MSTSTTSTTTNPLTADWAIPGPLTQLRVWGTSVVFPLDSAARTMEIGTDEACEIRVADPTHCVSRMHAVLRQNGGQWEVIDRESKNGLYVDGVRLARQPLVPGAEIGLGGVMVLVAESAGVVALRAALQRMIGYDDDKATAVDLSLRGVRHATQRREVLVLAGDGDLLPLAREIHDLTLTPARPFVVCAPKLVGETSRQPERIRPTARGAALDATDGTVCLLQRMLPPDFITFLAERAAPGAQARVMVCARSVREVDLFTGAGIVIPRLAERKADLPRLLDEYERAACATFHVARPPLTKADRTWIRQRAAFLPEMHRMVEHLVARYAGGSFTAGAALLGITHRAMTRWFDDRGYPRGKNSA